MKEFIDHYRQICKDLVDDENLSFGFDQKKVKHRVNFRGPGGLNSLDTGFSILMIKIIGLVELETLSSLKKIDKIREDFAFKFKLGFRKSDIIGHYKKDALICLMPYTLENDAVKMVPNYLEVLSKLLNENGIPGSEKVNVFYSLAHYPEAGEETFMLLKKLEEQLGS